MPYIKGKWKWQKSFEDRDYQVQCQCSFVSNGETFYGIGFGYDSHKGCYVLEYERSEGSATAGSSYYDETTCNVFDDYRIIDFGDTEQYIDRMLHEFILDHAEPYFTIPEKLEKIASNEQKVHKAGYDLGHDKGYDEGLDVGYQNGFEEGKNAGGYDKGFEDGKDAFWDAVQQNGKRQAYDYAFLNWGGEYIRPKYKVIPTGSTKNIVYNCPDLVKVEAKYFDLSQVPYNISRAYDFGTCSKLVEIEDIGLQPGISYDHFACWDYALKKVACIRLDENTLVNDMLISCPNLEEVNIEGVIGQTGINLSSSTKLKAASIESIINHLSDTATGKTLTLSKTAVDNAYGWYLPDGSFVGGSNSGHWGELEASKPNWTITLV